MDLPPNVEEYEAQLKEEQALQTEEVLEQQLLRTPASPAHARLMLAMVLRMAHRRQVTDQYFVELVNECTMVQVDIADLEKAAAMRNFLLTADPTRDPKVLDAAADIVCERMTTKLKSLSAKVKLMLEMKSSKDTVH